MTPLFLRGAVPMTVLASLIGLACMPGCAGIPYIAGETQGIKESTDLQTGSNLSRRDKANTGAREMDKDVLESSLRGINANRDNGR